MNTCIMKSMSEPEMKTRSMKHALAAVILTMGLTATVAASPVGVYIDDNFNGTALNLGEWTPSNTSYVTVSDSYVHVMANHGDVQLTSVDTVKPDAGQAVVVTFTNLTFSLDWGQHYVQGFSGINYQCGQYAGGGVAVIGGKSYQISTALPIATVLSSFAITWSPDKVTMNIGGTTVFDSSVNAPAQGGAWAIPTTPQGVLVETYINDLTISADNIKMEVIPEPASLALLGATGLLVVARRRRG